jgi:hypothetical protein
MKSLGIFAFCVSLAVPFAAIAQSTDAAYCETLSKLYAKEVGSNPASGDVPMAVAKCKAGDTAAGIPVLEKALKDAKVSLPPRG